VQAPSFIRSPVDEPQLIAQIKEGNGYAFRVLMQRYGKRVYDIAHSFIGNQSDTEDAVQDIFIKVYRSIHTFREEAAFTTWLYRITVNTALNKAASIKNIRGRIIENEYEVISNRFDTTTDIEYFDVRDNIFKALKTLSKQQRTIIILRHLHDFSTKETSSILDCSEGTVKTQLHRGLKKLHKKLKYIIEEKQ
jgi:RNA polymerase sigma-70 factor, ECF subfamily